MLEWRMWEQLYYPFGAFPAIKLERTMAMTKYGDRDEEHLQEKIEQERKQRPDGEKTAVEDQLQAELDRIRKGRQQDESKP